MSEINYAWDSGVFIAWLCEEATAPLGDIDLVVREIDGGRANLILSVMTYSEILESKYSKDQLNKLDLFLRRSNVITVNTTIPIAQKAAQIRDAGLSEEKKIRTPDATIIATAILHKAHVLHTLDKGILSLNGTKIVDGLAITTPYLKSGDKSLPF
ncbi:MAG TPA: PIN domain-containing protein [Gemmataceae bacterium]|nr:PIN domain-containing protein [Gemmataceae bacterium]